ncbi:MAG: cofactor-independent phosphoglycerate mutase [Candidatus Omnitrophica bacterium]|nr:cofactor-independent phosphoglycerate mutase [Candidatus Omnitrophota bacterium]
MKYILLVGDGMADRPIEELNGKTVLEAANTQYMDQVVSKGRIGLVKTIPTGMIPASDVANLSIIGYDPNIYYTGRGPLEAANMGIELGDDEVAFRCNTVTVGDDEMVDYSAGHISTKESSILIDLFNKKAGKPSIRFYAGVSYRNLMILKCSSKEEAQAFNKIKCMAPHDIMGKRISKNLPKGKGSELLIDLMNRSRTLLLSADVNKVRIDLGENPANMIWLWGQGVRPSMPSFKEVFGLEGSVISAVDLVNGMGVLLGLEPVKVPGATGYYDTNYKGKAEYALKALEKNDFVFVHVEAPDEAGHNGDVMEKIKAIENFDRLVVGTIYNYLKNRHDFRMMVLPDHATPISVRSHTDEPVPFAICGEGVAPDETHVFTEKAARASSLILKKGSELMGLLVNKK